MRNMQALKGSIGVFALVFAASLLLLLPGCQGPLGPQNGANDTGTVSLTIEMPPIGRAIMPDVSLGDFTDFRLAFAGPAGGSYNVVSLIPGAENLTAEVELTLGAWTLVVTAYLSEDDYDDGYAAAASLPVTLTVGAGNVAVSGPAVLLPITDEGVDGLFTWDLSFPADGSTTTGILEVFRVDDDGDIGDDPVDSAAIPFTVTNMTLPAGTYYVLITLENNVHGELAFGIDLHVYGNMTSHFERDFGPGRFRGCECDGLWMLDCECDPCDCDMQGDVIPNLNDIHGVMPSGSPSFRLVGDSLFVTGRTDGSDGVQLQRAAAGTNATWEVPIYDDATRYRLTVTGRAPVGVTMRLQQATSPWGWLNSQTVTGIGVGTFTLTHIIDGSALLANNTVIRTDDADEDANFMIDSILFVRLGACDNRVGDALIDFNVTDTGVECECGDLIEMPLSYFISFGGLLENADRPDWYYVAGEVRVLAQGPFAPFGPLTGFAGTAGAWVADDDGALALRQTGRTENWHGLNLVPAGATGLGLIEGDRLTIYGRAVSTEAVWARAELQYAVPDAHDVSIQDQAGERSFRLVWNVPEGALPDQVRVTVNGGGANTHTVYVDRIEIYRPDPGARFGNLPSVAATVNLAGIAPELIRFNTAVATDVATITTGNIVTAQTTDGNFLVAADGFSGNSGTLFTIGVPAAAAVGDVIHVAGRKGSVGGDGYIQIAGVDIGRGSQNIPGQFQFIEAWVRAITLELAHITGGIPIIINAWAPGTVAGAERLNYIGFEIAIDQIVVVETVDPYITQRLALEAAIAAAERFVQQAYTPATWTMFNAALVAARGGVGNTATGAGAAMDGLRNTLTSAQAGLDVGAPSAAWQDVLASDYVFGRATTPVVTSNGLLITNRGDNNVGLRLNIAAMRATYGGVAVPVVVTGYMAQPGRIDGQGFSADTNVTVAEAHGAFTFTVAAGTNAAVWTDQWWGTAAQPYPFMGTEGGLLADFIVTGIQVGTMSIQDLLATDVPPGYAGLNISFDDLRNRIAPITHTVPLSDVVGSTIGAPTDGFTGHTWSHNLAVIHSGPTLTLDASFARAGRHLVTLRANFGGRTYSQIVEITVTP